MFVCRVSKIGRGCKIVTTACLFGCLFFFWDFSRCVESAQSPGAKK